VRDHRRHSRSFLIAAFLSTLSLTGLVLTGLVFTGLDLIGPTPAAADPGDDAEASSKAVDRAEAILEDATAVARNAARRLEAATAALPAAQAKVDVSRGLVAAARVQANTARREADAARKEHAEVAAGFRAAQARVSTARDRVDEIATASYMGSSFARVNVLAAATGPQDMMDRLGLVDQVMQKQNADVDTLTAARRKARTEQDKAGLAKRAAEQTAQAAKGKLAAARAAETAAEQARAAVVTLTESRAGALAAANSQRAAVLAKYGRAKAEEARIQRALRSYDHKGGSAGGPYIGGKLAMPVHGYKSSDFGERYDPYYRVWQLHAGTDFAAGGGTPIHAAAGGRVIQAGWNGGYGNYTCISHGEVDGHGFSTCYGHQSKILVHVGEHITRGETIGRVGTTGASTGYHLHFETRFDGVPKNPVQYLPPCLC
jgi:murein DD-endopeptidase MepM/ murein hydrolase activator NlpD